MGDIALGRGIYETSCVRGGLFGSYSCPPQEDGYGALCRFGRHMDVSKPSVCHAVSTLKDGGFLTIDEDHFLYLTDIGLEVAETIYERHCFFTERLIAAGVDPKTAEADACRMEHVISTESFLRLKEAAAQEQEQIL